MKSNLEDVQEFHDKFEVNPNRSAPPHFLPDDLARFRLGFLIEELGEYAWAIGAAEISNILGDLAKSARKAQIFPDQQDMVKAFDSLIDLNVVSFGTIDLHCFPYQRGWDAVQAANMAKERAKPDGSNSARQSKHDIVKPEGWVPPDGEIRRLLINYGAEL